MTVRVAMGTSVITYGKPGSRTVINVPRDPRILVCPTCCGEVELDCWMCVGVGLIYAQWIPTKATA